MDGYRVFTWAPKRFPDPRRLVADLASGERPPIDLDAFAVERFS